ncbi:tetratricopeptide repeat protein [Phytohalomonas tamaricis]|uniref:tetratricopeptide repeat protein n=1 Tax=Phytohalomonas tamaricis TaxID=2081032 RepID=UPI000D0B6B54|nr:tetratricopeptide repeat protein [Phytohalomonas tamaricis]
MPSRSLFFPIAAIFIASGPLWLAGCQSTPPMSARQDPLASAPPITQGLDASGLSQLLGAEIAGQRGDFAAAARGYYAQSERYDSLALAQRATLAARYAGDPALFERAARRWAELSSQSADATAGAPHRILAEIAGKRGDWDEALRQLLAVDALGENIDLEAFVEDAVDEGAKPNVLLNELDSYIAQHSDRPAPRIAAALLDTREQQFDTAATRLASVEQRWPELPILWLARSQLELERDQPGMALKAAQRGQTLAPDDSRFVLAMAQAHLALDNIDLAEKQFDTLLKRHPNNTALRLSLARLYLQYGHATSARRILLPLVANSTDAPDDAYFLLALIAEQQDDIDSALLYYRQVREGEQFIASRARAAQLLIGHDRLNEARIFLDTQRQRHPASNADLLAIELMLLDQAGQSGVANRLLDQEIAAQAPNNSNLIFTRAMRAMQADDLQAMERDMKILLERNPDDAEVLNAYGYTLTERTDRHEQALELIKRAHELDPQSPAIMDSLGWVYFHLGEFERAEGYLQRAYAAMPDEEVAAHLAELLINLDRPDDARTIVLKALDRFETHPTLDSLLKRHPQLMPFPVNGSGTSTPVFQENAP